MSKLSEKSQRQGQVDKLKEKINNEIKEIIKRDALELLSFEDEIDDSLSDKDCDNGEEFINLCNEVTICTILRDFINLPNTFMEYSAAYGREIDKIFYTISDEHIDMWLENDFNFMARAISCFGLNVFEISEKRFQYDFTSVFEDVLYRQKKERELLKI